MIKSPKVMFELFCKRFNVGDARPVVVQPVHEERFRVEILQHFGLAFNLCGGVGLTRIGKQNGHVGGGFAVVMLFRPIENALVGRVLDGVDAVDRRRSVGLLRQLFKFGA